MLFEKVRAIIFETFILELIPEMGSAPASGAANDAVVVGRGGGCANPMIKSDVPEVQREGALNSSRDGCAPRSDL
ncbi:MAG: hypothetical protein M3Y82_13490 [Verrucomicrobiota bacterium]|nr:hypothetical protein [Verrucomicrobiota bacterium]